MSVRVHFDVDNYVEGDVVRVASVVRQEPILYEHSRGIKANGLRAYVPIHPEINYGDRIVIEGIVEGGELKDPVVINVEESTGFLYVFRKKLQSFYHHSLPLPHDSLVSGFVLGSKSTMPQWFWEALKKTGTAHVVVASGMNITLVAGFLMTFLILFVPRRKAIVLALVGVWMYAVLAGFDAPIIRAAVMGAIGFVAVALGRLKTGWRALFISAASMLIVKPDWAEDLGFILSFVATASIMIFGGWIRARISRVPKFFREDLSTTLAAQIGVAPILFVTFGYFNVLSPLINILILWTVVPVTLVGGIAGIVGLVYEPLGSLILLTIYPLTWWFVKVVEVFN